MYALSFRLFSFETKVFIARGVEAGGVVNKSGDVDGLKGALNLWMLIEDGAHDYFKREISIVSSHIHCDPETLDELSLIVCLQRDAREVRTNPDHVLSLWNG